MPLPGNAPRSPSLQCQCNRRGREALGPNLCSRWDPGTCLAALSGPEEALRVDAHAGVRAPWHKAGYGGTGVAVQRPELRRLGDAAWLSLQHGGIKETTGSGQQGWQSEERHGGRGTEGRWIKAAGESQAGPGALPCFACLRH